MEPTRALSLTRRDPLLLCQDRLGPMAKWFCGPMKPLREPRFHRVFKAGLFVADKRCNVTPANGPRLRNADLGLFFCSREQRHRAFSSRLSPLRADERNDHRRRVLQVHAVRAWSTFVLS